jgi:hypothetical protein
MVFSIETRSLLKQRKLSLPGRASTTARFFLRQPG